MKEHFENYRGEQLGWRDKLVRHVIISPFLTSNRHYQSMNLLGPLNITCKWLLLQVISFLLAGAMESFVLAKKVREVSSKILPLSWPSL